MEHINFVHFVAVFEWAILVMYNIHPTVNLLFRTIADDFRQATSWAKCCVSGVWWKQLRSPKRSCGNCWVKFSDHFQPGFNHVAGPGRSQR
jgi:hypothetical protein